MLNARSIDQVPWSIDKNALNNLTQKYSIEVERNSINQYFGQSIN